MNTEAHKKSLRESIDVIGECVRKGISERQKTIGFHCSSGAIDMMEMLLHKENLVSPGFILKHDWLGSERKIKEKLPFDFRNKRKIINSMMFIEEKRNLLCYGKPQREQTIREVIEKFNELRRIFRELDIDEK